MRLRVGPSVLQIRRSALVASLAILVFTFGMVYLVMRSEPLFNTLQDNEAYRGISRKSDISLLEERLQNLESELQKNRIILGQVRDTVNHLTSHSRNNALNLGSTQLHLGNRTHLRSQQCGLDSSFADSDHNMLDVYEKIKFDNPDGGVWKQGWSIEYDESQWNPQRKLRVFVMPHSHNDPGWLKTFDKYFVDQTRHILNNMVVKMKEDQKWRFIWAEVSFLKHWWGTIDDATKDIVRRFVSDGQLEIVTGGWVMNDEANTHYFSIIEQMMEGHQWLEHNLDFRPRNGWAIDPFGLSPTMAYLLRRMGLENMVIQRVHYNVKKYLAKNKSVEFLWRQAWDHNRTTDILCHTMPFFSYDVPHTCGPDPKICCQYDFKRLPGNKVNCPWRIAPVPITDANVEKKAFMLLDQYRKKSQLFRSNVVLVPLGDDFRYDKVSEWDNQFRNYQKLFDFMNGKSEWNVEAQFGTLDEYFTAVREEVAIDDRNLPVDFPSLVGDFFTYADRDDHYWSGYYTSRPFYKNMDRVLEANLRGAEILFSLMRTDMVKKNLDHSQLIQDMMNNLVESRRNLALFQHHDAITGTSRENVAGDYANRLLQSLLNLEKIILQSSQYLLTSRAPESSDTVYLNMDKVRPEHSSLPRKTVLQFSLEKRFWTLIILNSLAHSRQEIVTIRCSTPNVEVRNSSGYLVPSQVGPAFNGANIVPDEFEVSFLAEVSAVSLTTFAVHLSLLASSTRTSLIFYNGQSQSIQDFKYQYSDTPEEFTIKSSYLGASFSGSDGLLRKVMNFEENTVNEIRMQFLMYGTRPKGRDRSGAYLFLPDSEAQPILYAKPQIRVSEGPLMSEVVVFLPHVEHHIKIKHSPGLDGTALEIVNFVDLTHEVNKEIVMRLYTNITNSNREFFTDLNGFQMAKRKTLDKLPLQANVYPFPTMTFLQDNNTRLSLATAQPLGVASLKTGWLEVFLDRRLNQDDNRGLQQGLTDNKLAPVAFRLLVEHSQGHHKTGSANQTFPSLLAHHASLSLLNPMFTMIDTKDKIPPESWYTALGAEPPCDIQLVNLRSLLVPNSPKPDNISVLYLHRVGFDCTYQAPALSCGLTDGKINLSQMFPNYFGTTVEESSLSLMYDGSTFPKDSHLQLPIMEIVTLKLHSR